MDQTSELRKLYRTARKQFDEAGALQMKAHPQGYDQFFAKAIDMLYRFREDADQYYAATAGEVISRLFSIDVCTGYSFFHDDAVIRKVWAIYDAAAAVVVKKFDRPRELRRKPPYKIACISMVFGDAIAPVKALSSFAMALDRELFDPLVLITNQLDTMRRFSKGMRAYFDTEIGRKLINCGIPIAGIPTQENMTDLAGQLIKNCYDLEIDIVVSNGSAFCFPEACLACSSGIGSFFNMHRGFPLYSSGVDAILHWVKATRQQQLGPWLEAGRKVIDYRDGISVPPLPEKMPDKDPSVVRLITASNHLAKRLTPEFCAMINRIMKDFPQTHYSLIGGGEKEEILSRFAPGVRKRITCHGSVLGIENIMKIFLECDIYLNEFPVSGVRVCLEAMCSCLPVVTMKCGDMHVNATAAEHVGDFAIMENDPEKYYQLTRELIIDQDKRRSVGMALRQRMEEQYDHNISFGKLSLDLLRAHEEKLNIRNA